MSRSLPLELVQDGFGEHSGSNCGFCSVVSLSERRGIAETASIEGGLMECFSLRTGVGVWISSCDKRSISAVSSPSDGYISEAIRQ